MSTERLYQGILISVPWRVLDTPGSVLDTPGLGVTRSAPSAPSRVYEARKSSQHSYMGTSLIRIDGAR